MKRSIADVLLDAARAAVANPKTSAVGIASVASFGAMAFHEPSTLSTPVPWTLLLTGLGFLFSHDGKAS
jgi:hypothetical protein